MLKPETGQINATRRWEERLKTECGKPVLEAEKGAVVSVKNHREIFPEKTKGRVIMENQGEHFKLSVINILNNTI